MASRSGTACPAHPQAVRAVPRPQVAPSGQYGPGALPTTSCVASYRSRGVRCSAASTETSSNRTPSPGGSPWPESNRYTPEETGRILKELRDLLEESVKLASSTGPRGITRGVQAVRALVSLTQEYLTAGKLDEPPVILRKLFERLGATYIKLGQFIASSPSLFPEEYVLEFQKCLDQTEPVPFSRIKKTIEEELSVPIDQAFAYIDPEPLASASVAQVHSATLLGGGKPVVLKVLKPGVEDILTTDLNFLYLAVRFLQIVSPELERTSITGIIEDIRSSMLDEVDFVKEAANIRQFSDYLDRSGFRAVATCPYVFTQYSSRRLLTLERLDGAPLTDLDAIRTVTQGRADPEQTLINALNTWVGSVLYCDAFHADVHAGNLLVLRDGTVGFLDFGIVGRVSPVTWKAVEALLNATATSDYTTMAKALATMKATGDEVDIPAFAKDLERLFTEIQTLDSQVDVVAAADLSSVSANVTLDNDQVNRLLLELVRVGETHGVRFPREFGLLVKQVLYFDRYVRLLAPELQVMEDSRVTLGSIGEDKSRAVPNTIDITPNN